MNQRRAILVPLSEAVPSLYESRRRSLRHSLNERVRFVLGEREIDGWTLNVSVGGIRAIVEESLASGMEVRVLLGAGSPRSGRIVWVQNEPDGSIVGVCFLDPSAAPAPLEGT